MGRKRQDGTIPCSRFLSKHGRRRRFHLHPRRNRMARAPSPAWRLSSPPQPEYSHGLRRSETQFNYRCYREESDELSNCEFFLLDDFVNGFFILHHSLVNPTIVVTCPKYHYCMGANAPTTSPSPLHVPNYARAEWILNQTAQSNCLPPTSSLLLSPPAGP